MPERSAPSGEFYPLPSLALDAMPSAERHVVDILIEERAERLRENPALWWLIRRFLYPVLRYGQAIEMADAIASLDGHGAMAELVRRIPVVLDVAGLEHVPREGRVMIVGNHPSGIVDGLALYQTLLPHRRDVCFFANRDAIRVAAGLLDVLIPIEWEPAKRTHTKTKEMLHCAAEAFKQEQAVVMFPSGGIAQYDAQGQLGDKPWLATTVTLIRKFDTPVLPVHITARNSWLYYLFHKVNAELRNMTLFYEMLNKAGCLFRLKFGPLLQPNALSGNADDATRRLQHYVEHRLPRGLGWDGKAG